MAILSLLLLFLALSVYELGHAFAMRRYGIPLQEISILGFGGKPLVSFKWRRFFGETPLTIHPIIIGAYVRPTDAGHELLKEKDLLSYGHMMGAGVMANIAFGAVLLFLSRAVDNAVFLPFTLLCLALLLIGLFPRYTFFLMLPIGLFLGWYLVHNLFGHPAQFVSNSSSIIGAAQDTVKHARSLRDTLEYGALISLALAAFNCMPLEPLDGGKLITYCIRRYTGSERSAMVYTVLTLIPIALLILLSIGNDIWKLIKALLHL